MSPVERGSPMVQRFADFFGEEASSYFDLRCVSGELDREIVVINPMLGLGVREEEIIAALEPLGWKRPKDAGVNSTNCRLNDFGVYIHARRHGFHPYAFEIAEQLRHGLISREEATAKLVTLPTKRDVSWLAERLGLDIDAI